MSPRSVPYRIVLFSSLIWCLLIFSPPIASYLHVPSFANFTYEFFSRICHQLDSHSVHLSDAKLAVCARCLAIYLGFLLSVFLFPFFCKNGLPARWKLYSRSTLLLLFSVLPLLLDVTLDLTSIHESTLATRLTTGGLLGFVLPFVLLPAADEVFKEIRLRGVLRTKIPLSLRRKVGHAE